eukprot:2566498-Lingulodinium_polyedra.AAC.1
MKFPPTDRLPPNCSPGRGQTGRTLARLETAYMRSSWKHPPWTSTPRHAPTRGGARVAHELDYARPLARTVAYFLAPDEIDLPLDIPDEEAQGAFQGAAPMLPADDRA